MLSTDVGDEGTRFNPEAGDGLVYTACGYFRSIRFQMRNESEPVSTVTFQTPSFRRRKKSEMFCTTDYGVNIFIRVYTGYELAKPSGICVMIYKAHHSVCL